MVEFSKIMRRGKRHRPSGGGQVDVGTDSLKLSKLPSRRKGVVEIGREQAPQSPQDNVEKRSVLYTQATDYLRTAFESVKEEKPFSLQPGFEILEKIVDTRTPIDALFLKAIHDEDAYDLMISPSVNVAIYAIKMAENLGLNKTRQVEIGMVGLLHDIGMAKIPPELVYKQDLSEDEFQIFKERPSYGYDILQVFNNEYAYVSECALQIHERIDGSGYPRGLQADEINEYAQIIGLVDIYEALIHSRPQREKILHFYAVKEIIKTGKDKFQPRFLKALLNTFSIFPLNSYVRLNSGAIGRVVRTYPDQPMRPKVQIIYDSQSKRVLTERYINLPEHSLLYIVDSVPEHELIELSEASYLLTKQEQKKADSTEKEIESGEQPKIQAAETQKQIDKNAGQRLTEARATRTKGPLGKKILLALAVLFLVAGGAWQYWADSNANGQNREIEQTKPQSKDKPQANFIQSKQPAQTQAPMKTSQDQPKPKDTLVSQKTVAALNIKPVQTTPLKETKQKVNSGNRQAALATEKNREIESSAEPENAASEIKPPAVDQAKEIGPPESARYPFSILAASFKQPSGIERMGAILKSKGLTPYWVKVDLGTDGVWYRVFTGFYSDIEQAKSIIVQNDLKGALPKSTRFATWIGGFSNQLHLEKAIVDLSVKGFSAYAIEDEDNVAHLFVGAFFTQKGAETQSASLMEAGFESTVVER